MVIFTKQETCIMSLQTKGSSGSGLAKHQKFLKNKKELSLVFVLQ